MAKKAFWIGTTGPFYFDDAELQQDTGALLPAGTNQAAIITDGQLQVLTAPVLDTEVLRLEDVGVNTGDIVGPAGATDNAVARFDGATGKKLKNSALLLDDSGDLSKVATDLNLDCGANKTLALTQPVYEDLQVSISNIRIPTSSSPTERLYNHGIGAGVTFPVLGFAVNNYLYFDLQTSHSMKLNTVLDCHIHFMTPTDGSATPDRFRFQLDVIAAGINGNWAVPAGSPFTAEHIIAADYTNLHKLHELGDIPSANTTVSSIYSCKLKRIAATINEYGAEVYVKFIDSHYQKDTMGSRQEAVK